MATVVGLAREDRDLLQHNYNNLLSNLQAKIDFVITIAYTKKLIDGYDKTTIEGESDAYKKTRKFLDIVPSRGSKALELLLEVIDETVNPAVSKDIRDQRKAKQQSLKPANRKVTPRSTNESDSSTVSTAESEQTSTMEIVDPESGGGTISLYDDFDSAPIRRSPILSEQYLYKMENKPHGYALIINNRKFIGMPERKGSDRDAKGMQTLLVNLGYKVAIGDDLSAAQMKDVLQRWAAKDHSTCDSFVCVLLSHGEQGKIFGTDTDVDIEELLGLFRGNRCASLAGKPKLFFIQACRGTNFDEAVDHVDGVPNESALNTEGYEDEVDAKTRQTLPSEADFLIAYSVVPGYYSWRNSTNGSWFMQAVIDIFTKYYKQLDLITMLTIVNNSVATVESSTSDPRFNNKKQIPSCVNMLRKLVYFNSEAVKNHGIFG